MAKETKAKTVDETALTKKIAQKVQDAVGVSDTGVALRNETNFKLYMREALPGDDQIKPGHSHYVSNEVQAAVDWAAATIVRVFDTQREPVSFLAITASQHDAALAKQMTTVVNNFMRQRTKHGMVLADWVKNGFITGLGIVTVKFDAHEEEGLPITKKGLTQEMLVPFYNEEKAGKIVDVEVNGPYEAPADELPLDAPPEMQLLQAALPKPQLWDIKYRPLKRNPDIHIENLPPEDFIVSKDAKFDQKTGGIAASLQGHRRIISRADLIALDHDEDKVMRIPLASDREQGIAQERAKPNDYDQGVGDVNDDVEVFEIYTKMAIEDKKPRHYRVTLAGDLENNPVLLGYQEVSKFYPYAAFCPYPTPNTLFGQGIADRIGTEQNYISKMMRFVFNDLAQSADPTKVVNPDVTSMDDALNMYPGSVIRSEDPQAGISWVQRNFTGGNSLSVIQEVSGKLDFAIGVGPNMISLNASDLQNSTATAASQRANSSQLFMELVCRYFADTGYSYLVKLIVDALVCNPEDAQAYIQRLTDTFEPITVDGWDPDMDVQANVAFGVMNKDFNAASLNMILQQQMQAMPMGFVKPEQIRNTMAKIAENAGFTNVNEFYLDPAQNPPPPQQPAPDPNAAMIEQIKVKGQIDLQIAQQEQAFEERKLNWQNDIQRDKMAQDFELERAKIEAQYKAQVDVARVAAEQARTRNDVDIAMAQMDQQAQAMEQLGQLHAAEKQQQAQAQSEAMGHLVGMQQSGGPAAPTAPQGV